MVLHIGWIRFRTNFSRIGSRSATVCTICKYRMNDIENSSALSLLILFTNYVVFVDGWMGGVLPDPVVVVRVVADSAAVEVKAGCQFLVGT